MRQVLFLPILQKEKLAQGYSMHWSQNSNPHTLAAESELSSPHFYTIYLLSGYHVSLSVLTAPYAVFICVIM